LRHQCSSGINALAAATLDITADGDRLKLRPGGDWTVSHAHDLELLAEPLLPRLKAAKSVIVDFGALQALDTVGAWSLEKLSRLSTAGEIANRSEIPDHYRELMAELRQVNRQKTMRSAPPNAVSALLESVGRAALSAKDDAVAFLQVLGELGVALLGILRNPRSLRLTSTVYQLNRVGWQAIPIIALITFLIGAIIAQQGIFHFRKFGADAYVVDMVGILVLREIGVLIVAIMVAGRSGSAYTAEIGSMKMREEIDALSTMGLDPVEVLVLPRVMALVIALPILAFLGAMSALYGGGLVAWLYGGMSPAIFIARLHEAVSVTHFEVGILKAPFMALVIGIIATSEGLRVRGSAESLGRQTTTSVVKSIFLVIVLDGLFAIFFAWIGM
jgi:phospholipid/cholesterol/gamma-HCH transport system permease protein